ncbi:MAG: hypothetical protein WA996_00375 [Candidatus Promineifilaceae bacterium]
MGVDLFKEDWTTLFRLLEEGKIEPIIAAMFPILKATKTNEFLQRGKVIGSIVLTAQELS